MQAIWLVSCVLGLLQNGPVAEAPDAFGCAAEAIFEGEEQNDHMGMAVAVGGDFDADGQRDLLVGGGVNGNLPVDVWLFDRVPAGTRLAVKFSGFEVEEKGARPAMLALGDVSGGGVDDLAIGVGHWEDPFQPLAEQGAVFIYFGEDLAASRGASAPVLGPEHAAIVITGLEHDWLGWSLAMADVDGDERSDLLIGAPADPDANREGRVYLFLNRLETDLGAAARAADGGGPLLVPASAAAVTFVGRSANDRFGWSLANAGDLDGHRGDEFLVGAPEARSLGPFLHQTFGPGYAQVFTLMPAPMPLYELGSFGRRGEHLLFGYAVAAIGDIDGDGRAELAVGAPYYDHEDLVDIGAVFIYRGETGLGGRRARRLYYGGNEPYVPRDLVLDGVGDAYFGWSLAATGVSVDAGGTPDLVVGAPGTDHERLDQAAFCGTGVSPLSLADSGRVYLLAMPPLQHSTPRVLRTYGGDDGRDRLGWSVAVGDVDLTAQPVVPDVLAGANGHSIVPGRRGGEPKAEAGRAYLFTTPAYVR